MNEKPRRFLELYCSGMAPETAAKEAGYKRPGAALALINKAKDDASLPPDEKHGDGPRSVADTEEILEMLTSVMRGAVHDPVVVIEQRTGKEGKTERRARVIKKSASVKERMNAAEMLARRYGIFNGGGGSDGYEGVIFVGEDRLTDGGSDDDEENEEY